VVQRSNLLANASESVAGNNSSLSELRNRSTILVVEDDASLLRCSAELLRHQGYVAIPARDAQDALQIASSGARIDVLFTDVKLPHGFNGCKLLTEARRLRPGLPALFTSGYFDSDCLEGLKDVLFLMKPYRVSELEAALAKLMAGRKSYARSA